MKHIKLFETFVNEANEINSYSFNNREDFRKAEGVLSKANFYRSGSGNPPKGDEPGLYTSDEHWNTIKIVRGEKEALKLLKKAKLNYGGEYKKPMGYKVFNQGGYLD